MQAQQAAEERRKHKFKDWGALAVSQMIESIGPAFAEAAAATKSNGVDGKFLLHD